MWNGSRSGPQGGMPFRGEPRGGMFGRDGGRPDFRGRDGMNMDRPPMDVRRFDGPPDMRGQDMGFLDRGREPPRDFFGPGSDMNFRRPFEMDQRNSGGFMGQSRPGMNMNNRDMKGGNMRGPDDGFMNMDMRERLQMDASGPPIDIRRRLTMVAMGGNGDGADMRNRERPMMGNMDGFGMNMPPRDRPGMDFDRWGSPAPNNHRGRFDSEMNMRSRMGSAGDFRDLPSKMFRDHDGVPMDRRGRPDMPLGHGGPDSMAPPEELNLRDRKFQDSMETPKGFRGRESDSMCDDWQKSGLRDRDSAPPLMNRTPPQFSREMQEKFPPNHGNDGDRGDHSFIKKDGDMFPGKDGLLFPPPPERNSSSKTWDRNFPNEFPAHMKPPSDPPLNTLSREGDTLWQSGREEKLPDRMAPSIGRPPPFSKNPPNHGHHFSNDQGSFRGSGDTASDHGPKIDNVMSGPKELVSSRGERCDQDYRDIDYRTSSGRKFEYNIEELQGPKKDLLEPKLDAASQLDSSQDQDYRASVVPDKVSKTIAISEIPKTATMQQILLAFAVRNGVPMQGMKIKDVVPGYSYDTAYVEFLNLEDAVHFMETNQGSVKVGDKTARLQYFESDKNVKEQLQEPEASMTSGDGLLPVPLPDTEGDTSTKPVQDPVSQNVWERNSNLTPEAWQQQVDQLQQQDAESPSDDWTNQRSLRPNVHHFDPVFKESKTMIIKNILPTTTVETILKALEQYTYLDERNVRLVKGKSPGSKCFCFVDMDSHEHVTRLVDLLTKPRPIMIDGVRVYAEVAKPLKNQNFKRENEKSNTSLLGFPPDVIMQQQQFQQQQYFPPSHTSIGVPPPIVHGDSAGADGSGFTVPMQSSSSTPSLMYSETMTAQRSSENQATALLDPSLSGAVESSDGYSYAAGSEDPDLSAFLYDATSGFYYDPQTTLYYDPNSRYFYDAQNQQYLYWDSTTKTYIPVQSSEGLEPSPETSVPTAPSGEVMAVAITGEEMKAASETSPDVEDELGSRSERKEKEKEEKPKSLAAFKIMKDMERWAKIQNRHKDSVRTPSPMLKSGDDSKLSKAADAAFAIFERKVTGAEDLFKKPLAPPKKEERGAKRPMGSLGMLADDYGAGSDEEEEEKHEKQETSRPVPSQPQADEREDRLTDWKKMACLLCRRQFPNKDALIRHQQLSDLHKQNMEIHLKIKRSKKELEALENQEKEMKLTQKESNGSPEVKRRKQSHSWAGGSRGAHKGSERPGLGLEPPERKKKEPVVWNHATYKQAVRKAMFARFNELD